MSHYTVMVKLTQECIAKHGGTNEALAALMAPYQENNMGDCPKEYLAFHSAEQERSDYEQTNTETKTKYPTFELYVSDYCGYRYDADQQAYGYWENPNKEWDYWLIGGRRSGQIPFKHGADATLAGRRWDSPDSVPEEHADMVRVGDIDMRRVGEQMKERAETFWREWLTFLGNGKSDPFDGPRETALSLGLLRVIRENPTDEDKASGWRWGDQNPQIDAGRADWYDVPNRALTLEGFLCDYLVHFNPLLTYAALDADGWRAPGDMGGFGCSSDTPETKRGYHAWFLETFVNGASEDDVFVVVDCHI
jgi:hypothetical protein